MFPTVTHPLWAERWRSFIFEVGVFSIPKKGYLMSKMDHQSVVRRDAEQVLRGTTIPVLVVRLGDERIGA